MDQEFSSEYEADSPPNIVRLEVKEHFDALTDKEKHYAHYLSRASFHGTRIILEQVSTESVWIYDFIIALYRKCKGDWEGLRQEVKASKEELEDFLDYAAQFLGNCGNYRSFGNSKIIPRLSIDGFQRFASVSNLVNGFLDVAVVAGDNGLHGTNELAAMHLGYPSQGHMSMYYPDSPLIDEKAITLVGKFCERKKLLLENTRLKESPRSNYYLCIASVELSPAPKDRALKEDQYELDGELKGKFLNVVYGDHINEMAQIVHNIKEAIPYAANPTQKTMLRDYVDAFTSGSLVSFKDSQIQWIEDKGPTVEVNLGFIETDRDPHGVRGEWQGFVAMVNKERSKVFGKLVASAPTYITKLPWGKEFEKEEFCSPDFTSLEVLTFAGSGIPAGINIPNYDDIRQTVGFKNVCLGNVLSAKSANEPITFIREADIELFKKYRDVGFEIQIGLHELLGHGSGKLLQETEPGQYNFDIKNPPINPLTGEPITTWYKPGQTWSSVFGSIAASFEECRAECVTLFLACEFSILEMFGYGTGKVDFESEAGDVLYVIYLSMARAGICALEYWDPNNEKWGQPHMQARWSILQTLLDEGGPEFIRLDTPPSAPSTTIAGDPLQLLDLEIFIDRTKILSHGRPAIEKYLQQLHIYRSTADVEGGKRLYSDKSMVSSWSSEKLRPAVMQKRVARRVFVQPNTFIKDGKVVLKQYPATAEGMIQSFAERRV